MSAPRREDPAVEALGAEVRKALPICCEDCREDPDGALWHDADAVARHLVGLGVTLAADREPDALRAVRELADGWRRDIATMRADAIRDGDNEADWHASARQQHLDQLDAALAAHPATDQPEVTP